jgi:hypothetical protein
MYMIGVGLAAFTKLGHEIVSGSWTVSSAAPGKSEGCGSPTVFFTAFLALIGGPFVIIWRVVTRARAGAGGALQACIAQQGHDTGLFNKAAEQLGAAREVKKIPRGRKGGYHRA